MSLSPLSVSSEEQEQMLQTIEMFEVIIQASPQDCQSMEILKDAYQRVGKAAEALGIARRLADTYMQQGQYSQALYEYEGILQKDPGNAEVIAALGELEERLNKSGQAKENSSATPGGLGGEPSGGALDDSGIALEFQMSVDQDGGTLITTEQTFRADNPMAPKLVSPGDVALGDDGNEPLAKFLIQHRLVGEEVVTSALERVRKKNSERKEQTVPVALLDEICRRGSIEMETLLCNIVDRSKFAYIPLEYYDVDRSVVRMLPEHLTIERLIVPFDVMSRTLMIATANPFDAAAKETAQQMLDYNIQWHLASPQAIVQALASTYKVRSAAGDQISLRISQ